MVRKNMRFSIEEGFQEIARNSMGCFPRRVEFNDPLLVSIAKVPLSRMIDREFDRAHSPSRPVDLISRVFRRLRGA